MLLDQFEMNCLVHLIQHPPCMCYDLIILIIVIIIATIVVMHIVVVSTIVSVVSRPAIARYVPTLPTIVTPIG